jgi:hypothetical protein
MAAKPAVGRCGTGERGISTAGWALRGAAAGAAGTTALDAITYLDMAMRGRGASSTPEQTVQRLAEKAHVSIPGEGETRQNRVQGVAALLGLMAGVGFGVVVGVLRAAGVRPGRLAGSLLTTLGVMVATNGPMTALGVTDPRTWSTTDWLSDLVPHLVYGVVVQTTLVAFDRP